MPSEPMNVFCHMSIAIWFASCGPYMPAMAEMNSCAIVPMGTTLCFMASQTLDVPGNAPLYSLPISFRRSLSASMKAFTATSSTASEKRRRVPNSETMSPACSIRRALPYEIL